MTGEEYEKLLSARCGDLLNQSRERLTEAARSGDWKAINYELGWQDSLNMLRQLLQQK